MSSKRTRSPDGLEPPGKRARLQQQKQKTFTFGYDLMNPWHGREALLCYLRQKDLFLNGFISCPWEGPREEDFRVPAALSDPLLPQGATYADIHPILKRTNWFGITDNDYDLLKPALRLTSCFLQEPSVFDWWRSLTHRPVEQLGDAKLTKKTGLDFLRLRLQTTPLTDPSALVESQLTWTNLYLMQGCVNLQFAPQIEMEGTWGHTTNQLTTTQTPTGPQYQLIDGLGGPGNTCSTLISLRAENLEVLRGNIDPNDFVKARFHSQDEASTKTLFQIALTLSHELCHAYWKATFASGINPGDCEPFFEGHRLNELGSAFQAVVFGGDMTPLGGNSTYWHNQPGTGPTVSAPYGMGLSPWPGAIEQESGPGTRKAQRATPSYWGEENNLSYALPISYIYKFFTKKFWSQDVPRYGLAAYKPELWLGVAMLQGIVPYSPGEVAEGEPRDEQPPNPPLPTSDAIRAKGFKIKDDWDADSEDTDDSDASDLGDFSLSPTVQPGASTEDATVDPSVLTGDASLLPVWEYLFGDTPAAEASTGTSAAAADTGTPAAEAGTVTSATEVATGTPAAEAGADDTAEKSPVAEGGPHKGSLSIPGGAFTDVDWDEDDDLEMDVDDEDEEEGNGGGDGDEEDDGDEEEEDDEMDLDD